MTSRSVFISFLGASNYQPCNYELRDRRVEGVRFVQEALARIFCADFHDNDRIMIFLTDMARDRNWQDSDLDGRVTAGLKSRLETIGLGEVVRDVSIAEGGSSAELWVIFARVFDLLEENDRVILDITHGFRSLPMLGIVLLNYARILKKITIGGIYYGAFEVLGNPGKVAEMPLPTRNVPIFDLSGFAELLSWTSGVQEFVRHGNPAGIADLLEDGAGPRLRQSQGKDEAGRMWSGIAWNLREIGGQITTCRGSEINAGTAFSKLSVLLGSCDLDTELPPAFRPLLAAITDKVASFQNDDFENCLRAVCWCIDHDLTQQGITMLQEGLVSLLARRHGLDQQRREDRQLITETVNSKCIERPEEEWKYKMSERPQLARLIYHDPLVAAVAGDFDRLTKARNDINHAGFSQPASAHKLNKTLGNSYKAISRALAEHSS